MRPLKNQISRRTNVCLNSTIWTPEEREKNSLKYTGSRGIRPSTTGSELKYRNVNADLEHLIPKETYNKPTQMKITSSSEITSVEIP
jgi:hypothetical protein